MITYSDCIPIKFYGLQLFYSYKMLVVGFCLDQETSERQCINIAYYTKDHQLNIIADRIHMHRHIMATTEDVYANLVTIRNILISFNNYRMTIDERRLFNKGI